MLEVIAEEPEVFPGREAEFEELDDEPELVDGVYDGEVEEDEFGELGVEEELEDDDD